MRDADARGPVSSDAEEATATGALSHDGPVPTRSADDEGDYQDAEGKMDQYTRPSYHDRSTAQATHFDNSESLSVPVGEQNAPAWEANAMEDCAGEYSYGVDSRRLGSGFAEPGPATNLSVRAGVDLSRTTQTGMARGLCESPRGRLQVQEPVTLNRHFTRHVDQTHADPMETGSINSDNTRDPDETTAHSNLRRVPMGITSSSSGPATERRVRLFDERASQQPPPHGRLYEEFDGEKADAGGIECQRPALTSRGPTPDQSPQRFAARQVRAAHRVTSSLGRRPARQSLNHLPKVPVRGHYKS